MRDSPTSDAMSSHDVRSLPVIREVPNCRYDHPIVQRRILERMSAVVLALAFAAGCGQARAGRPLSVGAEAGLPHSRSSHVLVMVMENAEEAVTSIPSSTWESYESQERTL